jgi:hypothetical protein
MYIVPENSLNAINGWDVSMEKSKWKEIKTIKPQYIEISLNNTEYDTSDKRKTEFLRTTTDSTEIITQLEFDFYIDRNFDYITFNLEPINPDVFISNRYRIYGNFTLSTNQDINQVEYNISWVRGWNGVKFEFVEISSDTGTPYDVMIFYSSKGEKQFGFYFMSIIGTNEFKKPVIVNNRQ